MRTVRYGLVLAGCLSACGSNTGVDGGGAGGGGGVLGPAVLEGSVQKGPFLRDSSLSVSLRDSEAAPTVTTTTSDLGVYRIEIPEAGIVSVEARGSWFNEVLGRNSSVQLTLRALGEASPGATNLFNVNVVTHLTYARIEALLGGGASFADARNQAEAELREGLRIGPAGFVPAKPGSELDLLGGDTDENAYLLAVSAVVTQVAVLQSPEQSAVDFTLAALLDDVAADLAVDGRLDGPVAGDLAQAEASLDGGKVVRNLGRRLVELGSAAPVPEIDRILDTDDDGVANAFDDCRLVPDPEQQGIRSLCSLRIGEPINGTSGSVGDIDEDGKLDFIGLYSEDLQHATGVVVFPGDGAGSFGAGIRTDGGVELGMPAPQAFDIDGDGHLDLAYRGEGASAIALFGDGHGGFGAPVVWEAGSGGRVDRVHLADVDGDGRADLVSVLAEAGTGPALGVFVARSEGRTFGPPQFVTLPSFGEPTFVHPLDANGDGKVDLVVGKAEIVRAGGQPDGSWQRVTATELHVLLGDGTGGFSVSDTIRRENELVGWGDFGDLNGDGHVDLTVPAQTPQVSGWTMDWLVLFGDGTGLFPDLKDLDIPNHADAQVIFEGPAEGGGSLLASWQPEAGLIRLLRANGTELGQVATMPTTFQLVDNDCRGDFDGDGLQERLAIDPDGVRTIGVNYAIARTP